MDVGGPPGGEASRAVDYDPESVKAVRDAFPEVFGEDHRVLEIPDAVAAERGTHASGETLFLARIVAETDAHLELADVYRATVRADGDLYFVAKHWQDCHVPRDAVEVH